MADEIFVSGALVFKPRGKKTLWLVVKPSHEDAWQLPKGVVRPGESSVRAAMRTVSKLTGLRANVVEEISRINTTTTRNSAPIPRRTLYYLMEGKEKDIEVEVTPNVRLEWKEFPTAKSRLATLTEKKILSQGRSVLASWYKRDGQRLMQ
ncbi:NUDIX domain-containing protein [Candidatus Microgenomates bacterium]|nr:NUDIX domain-containing protein [Candidatus Microgenomates bacterium]